jgi:hypothetical protein
MDGGIIIHINKKHKNVLITIELIAYNFINTINNPLQKFRFSEYLKYRIGAIYDSNGFSKILIR